MVLTMLIKFMIWLTVTNIVSKWWPLFSHLSWSKNDLIPYWHPSRQEFFANTALKIIEEKLSNHTVSLPHLLFPWHFFCLIDLYYPQGLFIEMYNKRVKYNIGRMITQWESRIQRPSRASWSVDPRLIRNQILFIFVEDGHIHLQSFRRLQASFPSSLRIEHHR